MSTSPPPPSMSSGDTEDAASARRAAPPDLRPLLDTATIGRRVRELGARITADYQGRDLVVIPVLKGAIMFAADLLRAIDLPLSVDFLALRSYEGTGSSGVVQITSDLTQRVEGRDLLVVEDIVDTGLTLTYLLENLETRQPKSIRVAALLHKPARTRVPVDIDYLGFTVDDVFLVGYGLDHDPRFRHLPHLAAFAEPGEDAGEEEPPPSPSSAIAPAPGATEEPGG